MRNLLRRLNIESFVLNTRQPLLETPLIPEFTVRRIDEHTLEVDVRKEQNLNDLFARLSSLDIEVLSLRNKVNRLEEVFMRLVDNRGANGG
jgi:ABC-2 type transport system ATP-binding protein